MRSLLKATLVAAALGGVTLAAQLPAAADSVNVTVAPGGVAFGYSDGYWDQNRQWHAWQNEQERARFLAAHRDHYYDYRHDRDRDMGWRSERWWQHG